jgi:CheY-like chemotaxis protein
MTPTNPAIADRKLVVIVEDNETCAVTLQIALETIPGIDLRLASSGPRALKFLAACEDEVAAVITDLDLPGMSGFDLLARLKAEPHLAKVPVLVVSGDSDPGLPRTALAQGAAAFFTKPYSPIEVRRKLEQLLKCGPSQS